MRVLYVNVYETDRLYGGPEEGGWWYDAGTPVKTMPTLPHRAERLRDRVRARLDKMNRKVRPPWSMAYDGGWLEVTIEEHPAREYPEATPRYE